jgi:hypothetical protein
LFGWDKARALPAHDAKKRGRVAAPETRFGVFRPLRGYLKKGMVTGKIVAPILVENSGELRYYFRAVQAGKPMTAKGMGRVGALASGPFLLGR